MFAILLLILMSSQIDCHSICETIKPNGVFNGLQVYRKYKYSSDSYLAMNNKNGIEWQFDIASDGQYSYQMNDSMTTTTVDAIYRFGCHTTLWVALIPAKGYQNCQIFAGNASHSRIYCDPSTGDRSFKTGDYVIISVNITKENVEIPRNMDLIYFFDRKTKVIQLVYDSVVNTIDDCFRHITEDCLRKPPPFVEQMDNTLFNSIEGVVDYISSDGKSHYFILFQIDGRPKFCITSTDGLISPECKSSEKLTNLFGECFETSRTDSSSSSLVWVLVVVVLLVLGIGIAIGIVVMRRRRGQQFGVQSNDSSKTSIGM